MHQLKSNHALLIRIKYALIGVPLLSVASLAQAADHVFNLGNVIVNGAVHDQEIASEQVISSADLQRFNRDNVGQAVNMLPGVSLREGGPRNEQTVSVRGFDSRQVPVFLDGIPQYVPYDGNVDLARFTTFDLSEIRVVKGLHRCCMAQTSWVVQST